jgi:hypothetical protein
LEQFCEQPVKKPQKITRCLVPPETGQQLWTLLVGDLKRQKLRLFYFRVYAVGGTQSQLVEYSFVLSG